MLDVAAHLLDHVEVTQLHLNLRKRTAIAIIGA